MVKHLLVFFSVLLLCACSDYPSIDPAELDIVSDELRGWIDSTQQRVFFFTDSNGIAQTLTGDDYYLFSLETVYVDDDGNSYGTFSSEINYSNSVFIISVNAIGFNYCEDDGFRLSFTCRSKLNTRCHTAFYDFDQPELSRNALIHDSITISGELYESVMEVKLSDQSSGVSTLYYQKGRGIIAFRENGVLHFPAEQPE